MAGCNDTLVSLWETEDWSCVATSGVHEYVLSKLTCRHVCKLLTALFPATLSGWRASHKMATTLHPVLQMGR